ncbi:MAG TPA: hypothetical protein VGE72_05160 [Azospirillum sp.]
MSFFPRLALLALLPVLAACGRERVVADEISPAYTAAEVAYAASDRDLRVVIHGNPLGGSPQAFARTVTDAMQNKIIGVRTNFTTTPNASARPDYAVVLAFNPAETMLNSALCRGGGIPTKPVGGTLIVQSAFCRAGGALTSATGWLDEPRGLDDPALRELIAGLTFSLFPSRRVECLEC